MARYAQRTEGQRLHDADERHTRRARQQQQASVNAATEATLQAQHEETTRRAGNYSAVVRCIKLLSRGVRRMSVRVLETKSQRVLHILSIPQSADQMPKLQRRSSSVRCTYATLLPLHSRQRCCSRGRAYGRHQYRIFSKQTSVPKLKLYTVYSLYKTGVVANPPCGQIVNNSTEIWLKKGQGTHREQKGSPCMLLTKDVHGELDNSSRQT